jgi:hypothetical protein
VFAPYCNRQSEATNHRTAETNLGERARSCPSRGYVV